MGGRQVEEGAAVITDATMRRIMDAATSDEPDAGQVMERLWADLDDMDRMYAKGYVSGYVEAVRHLQLAGRLDSPGTAGVSVVESE